MYVMDNKKRMINTQTKEIKAKAITVEDKTKIHDLQYQKCQTEWNKNAVVKRIMTQERSNHLWNSISVK